MRTFTILGNPIHRFWLMVDGAAEDATMTTLVYKQQHALIDDRCNNSLLHDHVLIAAMPMAVV